MLDWLMHCKYKHNTTWDGSLGNFLETRNENELYFFNVLENTQKYISYCLCGVLPHFLRFCKIDWFLPPLPAFYSFFCYIFEFLIENILIFFTNKLQVVLDNNIKQTMLLINKYQIQLTTKILTNNYISLQFINNKLIILHNNSNINIQKLLTKNNITYKII